MRLGGAARDPNRERLRLVAGQFRALAEPVRLEAWQEKHSPVSRKTSIRLEAGSRSRR